MRGPGRLRDSTIPCAVFALAGAVAFRLPEILNPGIVNSDSAVVGLQAMHILRGEWHWFLWGSGYQTTADSVVAAAIFSIIGATPLALMLTALTGHLVATLFAYLTLCRRHAPAIALLLITPLIASPAPTHTYTLHPPRQTALTLVFIAIWLLDGATSARRENIRYAIGAGTAALACFADPYALIFAPGMALLALLIGLDGTNSRGRTWRRFAAMAAGAAVGAVPFIVCRLLPNSVSGPLTFSPGLLARNWALFKGPCLSWVLGTRVLHQPAGVSDYIFWHPPWGFQVCQWLGAAAFAASFVFAIGAAAQNCIPWASRRLGLTAVLTVVTTIAGFLLSVMPIDHYASRYLVSLVLLAPFLFGVIAHVIQPRVLLALMAPMIASFAVSGWLGYEPLTKGIRIVDGGLQANEAQLLRELNHRGVKYAMADYWTAYRLTFMFQEGVTVVPVHESQDRYAPYRRELFKASRYAYIFDHIRSEESQATVNSRVAEGQEDRFTIGPFDIYVLRRMGDSS